MSRIMGSIHDRVELAGASVDYFTAEDVPRGLPPRAARLAFPWLAWRFASDQRKAGRPYDIVNVHEPMGAAIACRRGHGAAVVVTSHGVEQRGWELVRAEGGPAAPSLWTRAVYPATSLWQSRLALQRADHVCCLSAQDAIYLRERLGVSPGRITRIFPGAPAVFRTASENRDYRTANTLVFAGTWLPRKGVADLAAALELLHSGGVRPSLIVLGAGVRDDVVFASFSAAVRPYVRCVTAPDDESAASVFASADVFVLPSLFEGTPLTLIEAMMSGLPIVTTATSGMRDVVEHGRTGILVDVHDPEALARALRGLFDHQSQRAALGEAARRFAVERHTWEHVSRPVIALYERLASRRAAA